MELWIVSCDRCHRQLECDDFQERLWESEDEAREVMDDVDWVQAENGDVVCDGCQQRDEVRS